MEREELAITSRYILAANVDDDDSVTFVLSRLAVRHFARSMYHASSLSSPRYPWSLGVCLVFNPLLYYKQHGFPLPKLFPLYCPSQCNYRASQLVSTHSCIAHATTRPSALQVETRDVKASNVPRAIVTSVRNIRSSSIWAISRHGETHAKEVSYKASSPTRPAAPARPMPRTAVGSEAPPDEVALLLSLSEPEESVVWLLEPLVVLGVLPVVASVEFPEPPTTVGAPETEDEMPVALADDVASTTAGMR
jgi:hypothetical protein